MKIQQKVDEKKSITKKKTQEKWAKDMNKHFSENINGQ